MITSAKSAKWIQTTLTPTKPLNQRHIHLVEVKVILTRKEKTTLTR